VSICIADWASLLADFEGHNYHLRSKMEVAIGEAAFHLILSLKVDLTACYAWVQLGRYFMQRRQVLQFSVMDFYC
jgi:hypothetical protein